MTNNVAIKKAADLAGGQSALARALGLKPQAIQRWCKTGAVPANRVLQIETVTKKMVSRHELRPDLYPADDML